MQLVSLKIDHVHLRSAGYSQDLSKLTSNLSETVHLARHFFFKSKVAESFIINGMKFVP